MAQKTWLPQLLHLMDKLCSYILRWNTQIKTFIPEEDHNKVDLLVAACNTLHDVIVPLLPPET